MGTQPSGIDSPRASVLEPHWWAPAMALHERIVGAEHLTSDVDETTRARLAGWQRRYGAHGDQVFGRRLADTGLDERTLLLLLAESPASLAARADRPPWARVVEQAIGSARPPVPGTPVPPEWREAFIRPLLPLVSTAVEWVVAQLTPRLPAAYGDLSAIAADFATALGRRLAGVAAGTFVVELHAWRDAGRLLGLDGQQRFDDFVRRLSEPAGLVELFSKYPVLARLLAQCSQFEAEALVEMIDRFVEERAEIVWTILTGTDPGPLHRISGNLGDAHQRGRRVQILSFTDGTQVVYKPRGLQAQLRLTELIEWINQTDPRIGLRAPAIVGRDDHGWMEFVAHTGLTDREQVVAFYRRLGALLALLHTVHATDMHHENVIACGDQPVVVDAETVFHPTLLAATCATDPAALVLATSVSRTALLPSIEVGDNGVADLSGLGGAPGSSAAHTVLDWESAGTDQMRPVRRAERATGAPNRPRINGQMVEPAEYRHELMHGFRLGYNAIARNRARFTEVVRSCTDLDVRAVLRPTRSYRDLLDEASRPELLRDGLDRDQVFDLLWAEAAYDPLRWLTSGYEACDLWAGDIPLFGSRPGERDLWVSTGDRLPGVFERTEVSRVLETISALGMADRHEQEWIIAATMASRRPTGGHHSGKRRHANLDAVAASPDRLLAAACEVADSIVATGLVNADRTNWLGLELIDERQWLTMPMGAGLAHGYVGVALFLAQLFRLTGIPRYADTARRAVSAYPHLYRFLTRSPHLVPAVGCGGLSGLGGMAYGLARLAVLLADDGIAALVPGTVELTAVATAEPATPDWAGGLAGCLTAMTAVHRELGLETARGLAEHCADLLLPFVAQDTDPPDPGGFTAGSAGVACALARLAADNPRYWPAAWHALEQAGPLLVAARPGEADPGWCSGLAGRVLAAVRAGQPAEHEAEEAVRALTAPAVSRDLSLCHGELGVLEALIVLADTGRYPAAVEARRHRAGLVLAALRRSGAVCGTPGGVATAGLLNGLAGIGYGLLRLGFAAEVPSVLLLEPAGDSSPHVNPLWIDGQPPR